MRPLVRSRTLSAHSWPPCPQGKAVPSTSDMRYSSLYLACAWAAVGRPTASKVAAAAVAVSRVRKEGFCSFMRCLLSFYEHGVINTPACVAATALSAATATP